MNTNFPHIFIVIDGKRVVPALLEPEKNYHDKILMKALDTLHKLENRSRYLDESGTITLSIQNDLVVMDCTGFSKKVSQFLRSLPLS